MKEEAWTRQGSGSKQAKPDSCWRKSRIAARILIRARAGKLRARDRRWARIYYQDPDVTSRLIGQALAYLGVREEAYAADGSSVESKGRLEHAGRQSA